MALRANLAATHSRRAISPASLGKKDKENMAKERQNFIEAAAHKQNPGEKAMRFSISGKIRRPTDSTRAQRGLWRDQLSNAYLKKRINPWNSWLVS